MNLIFLGMASIIFYRNLHSFVSLSWLNIFCVVLAGRPWQVNPYEAFPVFWIKKTLEMCFPHWWLITVSVFVSIREVLSVSDSKSVVKAAWLLMQSLIRNQTTSSSLPVSWTTVRYRNMHVVSTNLQHDQHNRWLRQKLIKLFDN